MAFDARKSFNGGQSGLILYCIDIVGVITARFNALFCFMSILIVVPAPRDRTLGRRDKTAWFGTPPSPVLEAGMVRAPRSFDSVLDDSEIKEGALRGVNSTVVGDFRGIVRRIHHEPEKGKVNCSKVMTLLKSQVMTLLKIKKEKVTTTKAIPRPVGTLWPQVKYNTD